MIKVPMNGLVVGLNNENECKFREFIKLEYREENKDK